MNKIINSSFYILALAALPVLQGCDAYVYDHDGGWHHDHRHWLVTRADTRMSSDSMTDNSAEALAQDYGISNSSAEKMVSIAASTNANDLQQSLNAVGVTAGEMAPLSELNMPTPEVIQKISIDLNEDSSKIENVLAGFIKDVKDANSSK